MLLEKFKELAIPLTGQKIFNLDQMEELAKFIFQNILVSNGQENYRFCEIEFYIHSESHPDPYSHKAKEQKKFGRWYFHESGLDITFGNEHVYASFLVRGIRINLQSVDVIRWIDTG